MEDHQDYYKEILKQHFLTKDKTVKEVKEFMRETYTSVLGRYQSQTLKIYLDLNFLIA